MASILSAITRWFHRPSEGEQQGVADNEDGSQLILKDRHKSDKGVMTDIEVRGDSIHLQSGDKPEQVIPISEETFSLQQVDEEIRYQIARKISLLLPELANSQKQQLLKYVFRMLFMLANDQVPRVRRLIAEELRESYNAPAELIRQLAWDEELEVSAPILEFSPLLSEHDLLEIINQCTLPGICEAIAKRQEVPEGVSDAIVRNATASRISKDHARAISALLENKGAHLGENALEIIIDKAPLHEIWHESLIERPELTTRMVNKIARFVSQGMLLELQDRNMIDEELAKNLSLAIASRLQSPQIDWEKEADKTAVEMFTHGTLDAESVRKAMESGEREFVVSAISLLADIPKPVTKKILKSDDPKAVTALAWKAGLQMRDGIQLQLKLARIHYTRILYAKEGSAYPLSEAEMGKLVGKYLKESA